MSGKKDVPNTGRRSSTRARKKSTKLLLPGEDTEHGQSIGRLQSEKGGRCGEASIGRVEVPRRSHPVAIVGTSRARKIAKHPPATARATGVAPRQIAVHRRNDALNLNFSQGMMPPVADSQRGDGKQSSSAVPPPIPGRGPQPSHDTDGTVRGPCAQVTSLRDKYPNDFGVNVKQSLSSCKDKPGEVEVHPAAAGLLCMSRVAEIPFSGPGGEPGLGQDDENRSAVRHDCGTKGASDPGSTLSPRERKNATQRGVPERLFKSVVESDQQSYGEGSTPAPRPATIRRSDSPGKRVRAKREMVPTAMPRVGTTSAYRNQEKVYEVAEARAGDNSVSPAGADIHRVSVPMNRVPTVDRLGRAVLRYAGAAQGQLDPSGQAAGARAPQNDSHRARVRIGAAAALFRTSRVDSLDADDRSDSHLQNTEEALTSEEHGKVVRANVGPVTNRSRYRPPLTRMLRSPERGKEMTPLTDGSSSPSKFDFTPPKTTNARLLNDYKLDNRALRNDKETQRQLIDSLNKEIARLQEETLRQKHIISELRRHVGRVEGDRQGGTQPRRRSREAGRDADGEYDPDCNPPQKKKGRYDNSALSLAKKLGALHAESTRALPNSTCPADILFHQVILRLNTKNLTQVAHRLVRCLRPTRSDVTDVPLEWEWCPVPERVAGVGTLRLHSPRLQSDMCMPGSRTVKVTMGLHDSERASGPPNTVPENPLQSAFRPLYGGALIAIPELMTSNADISDYETLMKRICATLVDSEDLCSVTSQRASVRDTTGVGTPASRPAPNGRTVHDSSHGTPSTARKANCNESDGDAAHGARDTVEPHYAQRRAVEDAFARVADTVCTRYLRFAINSACAEMKRGLVNKFAKSAFLPVSGDKKHTLFSSTVPHRERAAIFRALGAGETSFPLTQSFSAWANGVAPSLGHFCNGSDDLSEQANNACKFGWWRRHTVGSLETAVEQLLEPGDAANNDDGMPSEAGKSVERDTRRHFLIAKDDWGVLRSRHDRGTSSPGDFPSDTRNGTDMLFRNSHAVEAMRHFLGTRKTDRESGFIIGETSLLAVARADAWMAAFWSLQLFELLSTPGQENGGSSVGRTSRDAGPAAGSGGSRNQMFNDLFLILYPHAVESLLLECRQVLESWTSQYCTSSCDKTKEVDRITPFATSLGLNSRSVELYLPFSMDLYQTVCDMTDSPQGRGRTGHEDHELCKEVPNVDESVLRAWKDEMLVPDSVHSYDVYNSEGRTATVAFSVTDRTAMNAVGQSGRKHFIALTPQFFNHHVCCWLGDVCDAYVGEWSNREVSETSLDGHDPGVLSVSPVLTRNLYGRMRLASLSTHLGAPNTTPCTT